MIALIKIYEDRLFNIKHETAKDMLNLIEKDEKSFYYLLMYFYLIKEDLGNRIRLNAVLANCVTLFCMSCNDNDIIDYYRQYIDINEIPMQIGKIYHELSIQR